jgi:uncharacterized protein (TIGR02996 family)
MRLTWMRDPVDAVTMPDVMAIVSKAVFEQTTKRGGGGDVGSVLPLDRYSSTHKALSPLAGGGALFLVTVRPPDEKLWLVAVLEGPELRSDGWYAAPNTVPIADVSAVRAKLRFTTGTGIQAAKGALGMSLQTPRALTPDDAALLRSASGAKASGSGSKKSKATATPAKAAAPLPDPAPPARAGRKAEAATATTPKSAGGAEALRAAVASRDGKGALLAGLAFWRAQRSPKLADLVDAISARVSGAPITEEREWANVARKKDPMDLGRLLTGVPSLPVSFLPSAAEWLAELPDDPRLARAVATWAVDPPTTSSSTYPFWTRMLERVAAIGDVRVIPLLQKRLKRPPEKSQFWPKFYAALERVKAKVGAVTPPALDPALLKELEGGIAVLEVARVTPSASEDKREDVPTVAGTPLHQAAVHLAAGRILPGIEALLVNWRETRVPAVADAIDRATRSLPTWDLPVASRGSEIHEAWMRALATPAKTMPQLLQYVRVGSGPRSNALVERQLAELGGLPDDPRIALRLTELACQFGASPERKQYWKTIFETIARARDVRTFEPLRAHFRDFTGTYFDHHRQARRILGDMALNPKSAFSAWPLDLDEGDEEDLKEVEAVLAKLEAKRHVAEIELLTAIADAWADDAARLIYADWLSERGHPRGELLVLACKTGRSSADERRLKELSELPFVYGLLEDLGSPQEIDRGLPQSIQLHSFIGILSWRSVTGYPLLALIETLDVGGNAIESMEDAARLILHPGNRRLQRIASPLEATPAFAAAVAVSFRARGDDLVRR